MKMNLMICKYKNMKNEVIQGLSLIIVDYN